jgi:hypothetical protein
VRRAALSLFFVLLLAAPADAAEELAAAAGRIQADAYGGRIAWAQLDASTGKWELVEHRDGKVRLLPVDAFSGPVRLDLGPGPDGGVVAVYAREGKLFLYDFTARKERALVEFGEGTLPSVWRGELFFVRRTAGRFDLWRGKFGTGRLAKLPGGPVSGTSGPIATEMRGSRVVYVWQSRKNGFVETELYEVVRGRAVRRDRTGSGGASSSTFVTPEIAGSRVYYGRSTAGSGTGNQLRRASFKDGRVEALRAPMAGLVTAVFDGARFLMSRVLAGGETGVGECGMRGEKPLSESICRLIRSDPVTGWTRLRSGGSR